MKGITDKEIIVANSAPVSGPYIASGDPLNAGIKAYFDMINAQGGIDGRKIRFLHQDDGNDPKRSREILEYFLKKEVFAYIGHFGPQVVSYTLKRIRDSHMPVIYFFTAISDLYNEHAKTPEDGRNCFPIQSIYITEGTVLVARAVSDLRASSIGVIYSDDDTGRDLMVGIRKQCTALSLSFCSRCQTIDCSNVADTVSHILSNDIDAVIIATSQAAFVPIALELARQNNTLPAITNYVNMNITKSLQIFDAVLGQYALYAPSWVDYQDGRMEKLEDASEWLGDYAMNTYAHCGWMASYVFCEGMKRLCGKEPTWENFTEAMEAAPFDLPFGGKIDFANGVRLGAQEMTLYELNRHAPIGWKQIDGLRSIQELLQTQK